MRGVRDAGQRGLFFSTVHKVRNESMGLTGAEIHAETEKRA